MVQLTRTITNQLIIGETSLSNDNILITKPYVVVPTQDGLQLFPYDAEIIGKELELIQLNNQNIIYSTEPNPDLVNAYVTASTAGNIEVEEKQLII